MTQKAITEALAAKANTADVVTKSYVDNAISEAQISGGGSSSGSTNLGEENAGNMVVVGEDGNITYSTLTEEAIIEALAHAGTYTSKEGLGLEIDYQNKTFMRI